MESNLMNFVVCRCPLSQWGRVTHIYVNELCHHWFSDNPLPEPMMDYCQLDHQEHISMKFYLRFKSFHSRRCTWKFCLHKYRPSFRSRNVLISARTMWIRRWVYAITSWYDTHRTDSMSINKVTPTSVTSSYRASSRGSVNWENIRPDLWHHMTLSWHDRWSR